MTKIENSFLSIEYSPLIEYKKDSSFFESEYNEALYFVQYTDKSCNGKAHNKILIKKDLIDLVKSSQLKVTEHYFLAHKDACTLLSKYGIYQGESFATNMGEKKTIDLISHDYTVDLLNPEYVVIKFVNNQSNSQIWQSTNGVFHSQPFFIDHIHASFHDNNYPLEDFLQHLCKKNNVGLISNIQYNQGKILKPSLSLQDNDINDILYEIEHHLEDNDVRPPEVKGAALLFYPNQDEIFSLNAWHAKKDCLPGSSNYNNRIFNVQQHILRNILGGDKFYKRKAVRKNYKKT
jgi:hypothetical protein